MLQPTLADLQAAGKVGDAGLLHNDAFSGDTTLIKLVLPDGVTSIESGTVGLVLSGGCCLLPMGSVSGLGALTVIGSSQVDPEQTIMSCGEGAFFNCTSLEEVVLPLALA
jgi:hypothetical protein